MHASGLSLHRALSINSTPQFVQITDHTIKKLLVVGSLSIFYPVNCTPNMILRLRTYVI